MKYKKIAQKPYCCVGACLEMVLNRRGIKNEGQEDIAYQLGLVVPEEARHQFKKARVEDKPLAGYGTQIQKEEYSMNNFFQKNNIALHQDYHYITDIDEARKFLKENNENDIVICCYGKTLYNDPHDDWGHMVLFDHIEDDDTVLIVDPSPKRNYEYIKLNTIVQAIKDHGEANFGGFITIKDNVYQKVKK